MDLREPPDHGEIRLRLSMPPASRQATTVAKKQVADAVRLQTRPIEYLLDGYITVDLEWHIHEKYRWESDASADVDNIVKPLLDAISGPEGLFIDDSQVKSFSSSWFSTTNENEYVDIVIKFIAGEWLPKRDLVFVRLKNALCYPVPREVREKALGIWLAALKEALEARENLETLTKNYYPARYVLPRGFMHRTRLNAFTVLELSALEAEAASSPSAR